MSISEIVEAYVYYYNAQGLFVRPDQAVIAVDVLLDPPSTKEYALDWEHEELVEEEMYAVVVMGENTAMRIGAARFCEYAEYIQEDCSTTWCIFENTKWGRFAIKKSNTWTE